MHIRSVYDPSKVSYVYKDWQENKSLVGIIWGWHFLSTWDIAHPIFSFLEGKISLIIIVTQSQNAPNSILDQEKDKTTWSGNLICAIHTPTDKPIAPPQVTYSRLSPGPTPRRQSLSVTLRPQTRNVGQALWREEGASLGAGLDRWIQEVSCLWETKASSVQNYVLKKSYLLALHMETCWILNRIGLNLYHTHLTYNGSPFPLSSEITSF